ncbi:MAG TPA: helix-turn-helix domain-containing protein [Candidatus Dormibacteraeota bacterium]|nr:helix-turn-helix domain-containing protein [Candidatus Dormibacteraeota bacterium]
MNKADLLLHPVRLRIVQAFASGQGSRRLTVQELARQLDDVPLTTLYRHVQALYRGGVLAIAASRRVRGTVERTYVLVAGGTELRPEDLATASREDHLRYFNAFAAGLVAHFARYLQRPRVDLARDGVGYRAVAVNLSDEELEAMSRDLNAALRPYLGRKAEPPRRRRLLATVVMPLEDETEPDRPLQE